MLIPIEKIVPDQNQPRKTFDEEAIKGLANSFESYGIISPLKVRPCGDSQYMIITGEMRYRAAKQRGDKEIEVGDPIEVTDQQAREMQFIENLQRTDILSIELGKAFKQYCETYNVSYGELSKLIGYKDHHSVGDRIQLADNLSGDLIPALQEGKLQYQEAKEIAKIPNHKRQKEVAQPFIKGEVSSQHAQKIAEIARNEPERPVDDIIEEVITGKAQEREAALAEAAKRAAGITIETPEELAQAADALRKEAKRRAETLLTPQERAAREAEAQAHAEAKARRAQERQKREEEERRRLEEKAREKVTQELFENPAFLKQAAERLADLKRREREARLKAQQATLPMPLTEADLVHKVVIGDAKEVLKLLLPSSVDLVVTSPPYFGLKEYGHNLGVNTESLNDYLDDLGIVFRECYRTLKDGTFLCVVVGQYTSNDASHFIPGQVSKLLEDLGFRYKREHIWVKPLGVQGIWNRGTTSFLFQPFPRNTMINIHHEHILIFQKGERPAVFLGRNPLTEEEVKQYCWSIWELLVSGIKEHPAPFPEAIPERLIKMYSYEGEVVLDPFLGAGTTMKVAKVLKRRSIGIEVSPDYLDLIQKTIGGADIIRFDEGKLPDFSYLGTPKA